MSKTRFTICEDSRPCFAKDNSNSHCRILETDNYYSGYIDGQCPFCKPKAAVTNGQFYPYNPYYAAK